MNSKASSFAVLIVLCISLPACLAEAPEDETVESFDTTTNEIVGGTRANNYPEAVLIEMKQQGRVVSACSGSLIAPEVVLTAGHCVHRFNGWNVTAPYAAGQKAQGTSGATFDWKHNGGTVNPNMHDVGLIFLSTPINLAQYPTFTSGPLANGSKVVNIGRINNGRLSTTDLFASKPLSVNEGQKYGFPFAYITSPVIERGDSGGPTVIAGTHTIAAVNSGGGSGIAILARTDLVLSWINQQVKIHGGSGKNGSNAP